MVLRIVLGTVLTAMAVGQLASVDRMPGILSAYGPAHGAAVALTVALIGGELVAGVWFLAAPRSRAAAPVWVYAAVAATWAALAAQAYARGVAVGNCGCFGRYLPQSLGWPVLLQDALLVVYAGLLVRGLRTTDRTDDDTKAPTR